MLGFDETQDLFSDDVADELIGGNASAELAKDKAFIEEKIKKEEQNKQQESIEFYSAGYLNGQLNTKNQGSIEIKKRNFA